MSKHILEGFTILNTRPIQQAKELSEQIRALGGQVIECPTLAIEANSPNWMEQLPPLSLVSQAIFISANAVFHSMTQFEAHNISWPSQIKVIAIGKSTASMLEKFKIRVAFIPEISDSEHLLNLDILRKVKDQNVLLFKGEEGRTLIEQELLQRKAKLFALSVYKRTLPKINDQFLDSLWQENLVDIILLTSEQSLYQLFEMFHKEAHLWLKSKIYLVISERLAKSAKAFGLNKIIISHPDKMIDALVNYSQGLNYGS